MVVLEMALEVQDLMQELEIIVPYSLGDGVRPISERSKLMVGSSKALLL